MQPPFAWSQGLPYLVTVCLPFGHMKSPLSVMQLADGVGSGGDIDGRGVEQTHLSPSHQHASGQ